MTEFRQATEGFESDPCTQGGQMVRPNAIYAFEQRMRELGVEV